MERQAASSSAWTRATCSGPWLLMLNSSQYCAAIRHALDPGRIPFDSRVEPVPGRVQESEEEVNRGGQVRLLEYGAAWRAAAEIAEAHRVRVRRAVLEEIDAGMSAPEAARLTGVASHGE